MTPRMTWAERIGWVLLWAAFIVLSLFSMRICSIALRCESLSDLYENSEP